MMAGITVGVADAELSCICRGLTSILMDMEARKKRISANVRLQAGTHAATPANTKDSLRNHASGKISPTVLKYQVR